MPKNCQERVYEFLLDKLISGEFAPGMQLNEVQLAALANVSRTPLREAFRKLESEGLVEQIRNCGVFVRRLTIKDLKNMLQVRGLVEGYAAGMAAVNITKEGLLKLDNYVEAHRKLATVCMANPSFKDSPNYRMRSFEVDSHFHQTILEYCDNEYLVTTARHFTTLSLVAARMLSRLSVGEFEPMKTYSEHLAIVRAFRARDARQAAYVVGEHIQKIRLTVDRDEDGHVAHDMEEPEFDIKDYFQPA